MIGFLVSRNFHGCRIMYFYCLAGTNGTLFTWSCFVLSPANNVLLISLYIACAMYLYSFMYLFICLSHFLFSHLCVQSSLFSLLLTFSFFLSVTLGFSTWLHILKGKKRLPFSSSERKEGKVRARDVILRPWKLKVLCNTVRRREDGWYQVNGDGDGGGGGNVGYH